MKIFYGKNEPNHPSGPARDAFSMENDRDKYLLRQSGEGEQSAYEQLFKKYYKLLCAEAFYLLQDEMEAEDQVQALYIELWNKQRHLDIRSSVKGYLYQAIRRRCLTLLGKRKTELKRLQEYTEYTRQKNSSREVDLLEQSETRKHIFAKLNELPAQQLQAFRLVYLEDKKYREAAEEMGISINSIKTHLKIAVRMLRSRMIKNSFKLF